MTLEICRFCITLRRPTQPGHPSMGRYNEYWRWSIGHRYRQDTASSAKQCPVPGLLAYWLSRLKAQAAMGPAIRSTGVVCYSFIGLTLAGLKADKRG